MDAPAVEFSTHRVKRSLAGTHTCGDRCIAFRYRLMRIEVGLVAGDEDYMSTYRHERQGQSGNSPLSLAVSLPRTMIGRQRSRFRLRTRR